MVLNIASSGHMHFNGTGDQKVRFGRSISQLYITTSGGAAISFDAGSTFMTLADATHVFPYPHVKEVHMQGGTWAGVGIST